MRKRYPTERMGDEELAVYLNKLADEEMEAHEMEVGRPSPTSWGCAQKLGALAFIGFWSAIMYHGCRTYLESQEPEQPTQEVRREY